MQPKLGILAGGGALPARIIARCRQTERDFFVIAIEDQTRPETVADVPHAWVASAPPARSWPSCTTPVSRTW